MLCALARAMLLTRRWQEKSRQEIMHSMGATLGGSAPQGETLGDGAGSEYGATTARSGSPTNEPPEDLSWNWSGTLRKIQPNAFNSDKWVVARGDGNGELKIEFFSNSKQAKKFQSGAGGSKTNPSPVITTLNIKRIFTTGILLHTGCAVARSSLTLLCDLSV